MAGAKKTAKKSAKRRAGGAKASEDQLRVADLLEALKHMEYLSTRIRESLSDLDPEMVLKAEDTVLPDKRVPPFCKPPKHRDDDKDK